MKRLLSLLVVCIIGFQDNKSAAAFCNIYQIDELHFLTATSKDSAQLMLALFQVQTLLAQVRQNQPQLDCSSLILQSCGMQSVVQQGPESLAQRRKQRVMPLDIDQIEDECPTTYFFLEEKDGTPLFQGCENSGSYVFYPNIQDRDIKGSYESIKKLLIKVRNLFPILSLQEQEVIRRKQIILEKSACVRLFKRDRPSDTVARCVQDNIMVWEQHSNGFLYGSSSSNRKNNVWSINLENQKIVPLIEFTCDF